jgi:PAS domain S-box-containing protein
MDDTRRTREQLTEELNMLRTLMDSLPDHIYAKDTEGRFIFVNVAQAQYMGVKEPAELVGKSDFDFYPSHLAERYFADEQAMVESGESLIAHEEPNFDHRTGETSWTLTTKVPVRDSEGKVTGIVGISRDITRLKQVESERERLLVDLERRSTHLETVAEVARIASGILDLKELFHQCVALVRERFNLYYVGLFLTQQRGQADDDEGSWVYLEAGTGEAGRKMWKKRHRLEVGGNSMVGQCVATGKARIALDVGEEAVHFKNPLLPDTRSELALPLASRGEVIGALSVQSSLEAAFTDEDIAIFQTLAGQLANAIENARLFEQTQAALQEAQVSARTYVRRSWSDYVHRRASDEKSSSENDS